MAKGLRDSWKDTGVGLGHAFRDLGKSLVKTGATALGKADQWANKDDYSEEEAPKAEENQDSNT